MNVTLKDTMIVAISVYSEDVLCLKKEVLTRNILYLTGTWDLHIVNQKGFIFSTGRLRKNCA